MKFHGGIDQTSLYKIDLKILQNFTNKFWRLIYVQIDTSIKTFSTSTSKIIPKGNTTHLLWFLKDPLKFLPPHTSPLRKIIFWVG